MKRPISIAIALLGTVSVGFWSGNRLLSQDAHPAIIRGEIPFVANIEKRNTPPTGAATVKQSVVSIVYARREDRSFARKIFSDGNPEPLREIADVPNHKMITLDPVSKSKITYVYSVTGFQKLLNTMDSESCPEQSDGASDTELGEKFHRPVKHTVEEVSLNKSQKIQNEAWKIPSLACFSVKEVATRSDGAQIDTLVTSLKEGTPPDELFEVPAEYRERSPLTVEHLYVSEFHTPFFGETAAAGLEKTYQRLKMLHSDTLTNDR